MNFEDSSLDDMRKRLLYLVVGVTLIAVLANIINTLNYFDLRPKGQRLEQNRTAIIDKVNSVIVNDRRIANIPNMRKTGNWVPVMGFSGLVVKEFKYTGLNWKKELRGLTYEVVSGDFRNQIFFIKVYGISQAS